MRLAGLIRIVALLLPGVAPAQQAIQLPPAPLSTSLPASQPADTFHFISDGPKGPGWGHPDEIARKYFHENLPALFERTITLDTPIPERATLRWIFTGPRAGFTVALISSKAR